MKKVLIFSLLGLNILGGLSFAVNLNNPNSFKQIESDEIVSGSMMSVFIPKGTKVNKKDCSFVGKVFTPMVSSNPNVTWYKKDQNIELNCVNKMSGMYTFIDLKESDFTTAYFSEFSLNDDIVAKMRGLVKNNFNESAYLYFFVTWYKKESQVINTVPVRQMNYIEKNNNVLKIKNIEDYSNSIQLNLLSGVKNLLYIETYDQKFNKVKLDYKYSNSKLDSIIIQKSPYNNYEFIFSNNESGGIDRSKYTMIEVK